MGKKEEKEPFLHPILTEGTKDRTVCANMSTLLSAGDFYFTLSTGTQSPFETYCPQLRPL